MGRERKKLGFRMIVAATALTFISSCVAPKSSFAAPKNPLLDKPAAALYGEWKKGACSADQDTGKIHYSDSNSFEIGAHNFKDAFALHCSEEKTVLVKEKSVMLINEGAVPKTSSFAESFGEMYGADEDSVVDYRKIENNADQLNLASTMLGDNVFVLGKNTKTGNFFLDKLNIKDGETDSYELGKLFEGNVDMIAYKGMVFMAGEARKGKNYLLAFKPDEKLEIFPFEAKSEMKGSVEIWIEHSSDSSGVKQGPLVLEIGKNKMRIDVDESKNLPENIKIKN